MSKHRAPGDCDFILYMGDSERAMAKCAHCNQVLAHGTIQAYLNGFKKLRLQHEALLAASKYYRSVSSDEVNEQAEEIYRTAHLTLGDRGSHGN